MTAERGHTSLAGIPLGSEECPRLEWAEVCTRWYGQDVLRWRLFGLVPGYESKLLFGNLLWALWEERAVAGTVRVQREGR